MLGLFAADIARPRIPRLPACGACGLWKGCQSPKMPVSGKGERKILIVGEAPGKEEDREGIPWVGASGKLLEKTLLKFGVVMRRDCWLTNAAICRPEKNQLPEEAVNHCRPNVVKAVKKLQPEIIIPLGAAAVKSVLGWLWRDDVGSISRWDGSRIPVRSINSWVCPTWHPAALLHTDYGVSQRENEVRQLFFERHLKATCKLSGRPWPNGPVDPASKVQVVLDTDAVASILRGMTEAGKSVALDYETNMLKPDSDRAEIVSCAVSDGETTIAYPWHGAAVKATGRLLRSGVGLIASNMKFEQRWSIKAFGVPGTWVWDTMLAAHILDCRREVSGLKFQAFATLGVDAWDEGVSSFLRAKWPNEPNRIREAPLTKLLLYNGLDALLEWELAQVQAARFKVTL